uniref:DEAD/DEAH box helicase n=1 Tax=Thermofilum adornatum TaxID=1365176 RepID=A0A7C1CE63_9CREN
MVFYYMSSSPDSSDQISIIVEKIENIFQKRFYTILNTEWKPRKIQEIALRNYVDEIITHGKCKKIVQMPTGSGKSILLSLLVLATVYLRQHIEGGDKRNIILIFAPLTRIKFQLLEPLAIASGITTLPKEKGSLTNPSFPLYVMSSDVKAISRLSQKLQKQYAGKIPHRTTMGGIILAITPFSLSSSITEARTLKNALQKIIEQTRKSMSKHTHVIVLCPHTLKKTKEEREITTLKQLKDKILAVFVDEAHIMLDFKGKLGNSIAKLVREASVAIGFTATPGKNTYNTIAHVQCSPKIFLHKEPIYSYDIMLRKKWLGKDDKPILVDRLVARFYRSEILPALTRLTSNELWKNACRERVGKYAEIMLRELERHFKLNKRELFSKIKVLVLAPNMREADIWKETLQQYLGNSTQIFLAHSNVPDPQGEIEKFVESSAGILIAVDMVKIGFNDPNLDALIIARPVQSMVAYVQMRGRVLRYPEDPDRLKLKHGAFILHLAAEEILEDQKKIARVERGGFPSPVSFSELVGYEKHSIEYDATVEVSYLGETRIPPEAIERPESSETLQTSKISTPSTPIHGYSSAKTEQEVKSPITTPGENILQNVLNKLLYMFRHIYLYIRKAVNTLLAGIAFLLRRIHEHV